MALARTSSHVEDPDRLTRFLAELNATRWGDDQREALVRIFNALNDLVHQEIVYYYRARKRHRLRSGLTRGAAVILGTAGLAAPLLASAQPKLFAHAGGYGYVLLALAGAALLVNRLFGATGGHIRFVTAQLQLERLITLFRLDWAAWASTATDSKLSADQTAQALALCRNFALGTYKVIEEETNVWGKSVTEALDDYAKQLSGKPPRSAPDA